MSWTWPSRCGRGRVLGGACVVTGRAQGAGRRVSAGAARRTWWMWPSRWGGEVCIRHVVWIKIRGCLGCSVSAHGVRLEAPLAVDMATQVGTGLAEQLLHISPYSEDTMLLVSQGFTLSACGTRAAQRLQARR